MNLRWKIPQEVWKRALFVVGLRLMIPIVFFIVMSQFQKLGLFTPVLGGVSSRSYSIEMLIFKPINYFFYGIYLLNLYLELIFWLGFALFFLALKMRKFGFLYMFSIYLVVNPLVSIFIDPLLEYGYISLL